MNYNIRISHFIPPPLLTPPVPPHQFVPGGHGNWSTTGCNLRSYNSTTNVAVCDCNHLTNFACLVVSIISHYWFTVLGMFSLFYLFQDISARITGKAPPLPPNFRLALDITSSVGVVLSLVGLIVLIITYLAFK